MTSQVMTTEQLRTQRKPENIEANFNTYRGFQAMQHMATSLANSTIIPEAFRSTIMVKDRYDKENKKWTYKTEENPNGVSNCIIALNMAQRLGADPMMIMQNLYLVDGRPSWSSQFIIAAINSSGRYSPLRFDITGGDEEIEVPYAVTEWVYNRSTNKKEPVESNQVARVKNYKCVAWGIEKATGERLESTPITMEMAVKEGWFQKNGSKWQSMPEQMLRYRAASFFGRIYAPDLLMGLRTQEEEIESIIDITPEPTQQEMPQTLDSIKQNVVKEAPVEQQAEQQPVQEEKKPRARKQPKVVETENVQNSTENKVVDAELTVEDLKRLQQEAENLIQQNKTSETAQVDVNKSAEIKKSYMKTLTSTVQASSINGLKSQIEKETKLTEVDRNYLLAYVKQRLDEEGVYQQGQAPVDKIKSTSTRAGLERMIADTQDVHQLETETAQSIKNHKAKMTVEDYNDLLSLYAQRKEVLSQQDIFADAVSLVDSYIAHIDAAQNVDRLNDIMSDPAINSLPDDDTARINEAYDRRYAEISE
ncbi:hypothetical protein J559_2886 [Acinetobacter sp. 983759]|uniref:hypothetical protein n=1 Tax=Acinetobacter sp. 983759 TaxID=1310660 RepID=UPI00044F7662|nr:hypothetical protein [Acinetobacter sp. 983759]EXE12897.1 hypothetical protein J559_2886 [Acinetobacter sp. 983759]